MRSHRDLKQEQMISLGVLFTILIVHWFADFVCQTDWMAKNKSTNVDALCMHIGVYTMIWVVPAIVMLPVPASALFILVTLITHFMIDGVTSKINTYLWKKGDSHNFFVSVGFDQLLHYTQLILTYYWLCL
jgi:hypothetical protein